MGLRRIGVWVNISAEGRSSSDGSWPVRRFLSQPLLYFSMWYFYKEIFCSTCSMHMYVCTLIYALPCWTKSFFKTTLRKKSLGPEKKKSFIPSPASGTWPANLEGQKFRPTLSTAHSPLSTWFTYWPQKRKGTFLPFCSDISGSALEIKNFSLHRPIPASFPLI